MIVQLIRIDIRLPEYGWTTQKVFHLMNFIVNGVRAVVFGFHMQVFHLHPKVSILKVHQQKGVSKHKSEIPNNNMLFINFCC
ncbi:hypothetical protein HanXRQr2_Chr09g0365641 [Helianthus annuus]|uniref:THH1/TOM1/TOM3 domain-containing protein n=1 Tax=Helianthus annuus TaxID=4232 RepID=A0A251TSR5_HELAN|nr:hypothetical protein HanXRQr2_Chr09g0365641 [Helianthus annuus]KAJ0532189.1 hypothetical protein HanIR_Chr09g0393951 [Helianthus annuus]